MFLAGNCGLSIVKYFIRFSVDKGILENLSLCKLQSPLEEAGHIVGRQLSLWENPV